MMRRYINIHIIDVSLNIIHQCGARSGSPQLCTCITSVELYMPFFLRNGSGDSVDPAGCVLLPREVPPQDGSDQVEGQDDEQTHANHHKLHRTEEKERIMEREDEGEGGLYCKINTVL